jgi:hypothetical protein
MLGLVLLGWRATAETSKSKSQDIVAQSLWEAAMSSWTPLGALALAAFGVGFVAQTVPSEARSCKELRSLCWTMRDDKNDCTKPYQRCLVTGTFVTPLGRVFKATK